MANPTPAQIQEVQTNLYHMQQLNDYINQFGQEKITHCFLILTEPDNNNLGLEIIVDLLEAVFAVVAAAVSLVAPEFSIAMVAIATLASSALNTWMSQPPPSLNSQFAGFLDCFTRSCLQLDQQLAEYHDNVAEYWDTQFTFEGKSMTLADLSNSPFPSQDGDDEAFETIATRCIMSVDQQVWLYLLSGNYFVAYWGTSTESAPGPDGNPPADQVATQKEMPASYLYWEMTGDNNWVAAYYSVNKAYATENSDNLNDDACNYIFQDLIPGVVNNPSGLFKKADFFTPDLLTIGDNPGRSIYGVPYVAYTDVPIDPQIPE